MPISGALVGELRSGKSPYRILLARPTDQPELFAEYLSGALRNYRLFGVVDALEYEMTLSGESTALFAAVVDEAGSVVGGLRVQGPYCSVDDVHALREWAGRAGTAELRDEIAERLPYGVIEIKAVWVEHTLSEHHDITARLARLFVHLMRLMDVRFALCTAAAHAVLRWQSVGGAISERVAPVAYPDERYRTVVLWWDWRTVFGLIPGDTVLAALMRESSQLFPPRNGRDIGLSTVA